MQKVAIRRVGICLGVLCIFTVSGIADLNWREILSRGKTPSTTILQKRQKQLEKQKRLAKRKVEEMRKKERSISEQLRSIRERVDKAKSQLKQLRLQFESVLRQLNKTRARVLALRVKLSRHRSLLAERLRQLYKHPPVNYVVFILDASDITNAAIRTYAFRCIIRQDAEMITQVLQTQKELELEETALKRQKERLSSLRDDLATKADELRRAELEQADLLHKVQNQRETYERYLKEWEEESRAIASLLKRLQTSKGGIGSKIWRGSFIKPVNGNIVSGFGYRIHPIFRRVRFHYGVDIDASFGTPIKAAGDGVVVFAGWRKAYGNTVILDHGGGLATLYAHCSKILVSEGKAVKQGQIIAKVGSTGLSTGAHLHFEVRLYGEPINPLTVR